MNENNWGKKFYTLDKEGNRCHFYYEMEGNGAVGSEATFRVLEAGKSLEDNFFESTFMIKNAENAKSIQMTVNNEFATYGKKGIPEAIIRIASHDLKMSIRSSSNEHRELEDEWRTISATKVWERLRIQLPNRVTYILEEDCFVLKYDPKDQLE